MHAFEDIKPGARLRGLDPAGIAEVVQVAQFGPDALNLVFRVDGRVAERLVYRGEESGFEFLEAERSYAFNADGALLRLASEAYRIRLAYLFDPYLAVSASQIEALPHQITAVYGVCAVDRLNNPGSSAASARRRYAPGSAGRADHQRVLLGDIGATNARFAPLSNDILEPIMR